jgi:phosphate transport system substrate-binding protein
VGFGEAYTSVEWARRGTIVYSEGEMHRLLTVRPFALGLSDLGTLTVERLPIKAMKVNGVAPTLEDVASGRYPLVKILSFVFREDKLAQPAKAFVDFARSPEGGRILRANGYLPAE